MLQIKHLEMHLERRILQLLEHLGRQMFLVAGGIFLNKVKVILARKEEAEMDIGKDTSREC